MEDRFACQWHAARFLPSSMKLPGRMRWLAIGQRSPHREKEARWRFNCCGKRCLSCDAVGAVSDTQKPNIAILELFWLGTAWLQLLLPRAKMQDAFSQLKRCLMCSASLRSFRSLLLFLFLSSLQPSNAAKAASTQTTRQTAASIPISLENIETALLALEKQRGTPELADTVSDIDKMVAEMKSMVRKQSKLTQQTINQAWTDFVSCAGLYDIDSHMGLQSIDSLAQVHANCRLEESGSKIIFDLCEKELAARSASELQRKKEFDTLNQFPVGGFCAHRTNSLQYDSVRGYIKHFRDHFASQLVSWEHAFNASTNATNQKLHSLHECYGKDRSKNGQGGKEETYLAKKLVCQKLQQQVEDAACDRIAHRADCVAYNKCYKTNRDAYFATGQTKESALTQSQQQQQEYHALARIKCVLDAYATYQDGAALSKAISECQHVQTDVSFLKVSFPDEEPDAMPPDKTDCLQHRSAEAPGASDGWSTKICKFYVDSM